MESSAPHRHRPVSRRAVFVPAPEVWPDAGVYQLWLRLLVDLHLTVGRLGRFPFPAGIYVYTGRALRGLRARVLRHARGTGRKHWHVDYLLRHPRARLERVALVSLDPAEECTLNQAVGLDGICVASGFGASDCRRRCAAHLWRHGLRSQRRMPLAVSRALTVETARGIPVE